jgi:hypothetical protein
LTINFRPKTAAFLALGWCWRAISTTPPDLGARIYAATGAARKWQ